MKLIAIVACLHMGGSAAAAVVECPELLTTPQAVRAQKQYAPVIEDEADDTRAIGYVGLSAGDLVRLLNGHALIDHLPVRLASEHAAVRYLASSRPGIDLDHVPRRDATRIAITDAWLRTMRVLIMERVPSARVNRGLFTVFLKMRHFLPANKSSAPLTLEQIRKAVAGSRLLATGHNPKPGLRHLATALDLDWKGDQDVETKARLEAIFADVPTAGGVRFALKPSAIKAMRVADGELPSIRNLNASDVLAILPNDEASNRLLDEVIARTGS